MGDNPRDLTDQPHGLTRRSLALGALGAGAGAIAAQPLAAVAALASPPRTPVFTLELGNLVAGRSRADRAAGWLVGAPARTPRRFELLGVEWDGPPRARIQARVRLGAGRWCAWTTVPAGGGHAPDAIRRARLISDPIWTGPADELQLRASVALRGVRAHLVDIGATGEGLGAAPQAGTDAGVARHGGGGVAHWANRPGPAGTAIAPPLANPQLNTGPGQARIIARQWWGGAAARPRTTPDYGQVLLAFVHHTATANGYGPHATPGIIRGIFHYHRDVRGWNDIGYNFLVDRYGQVFEGRAGGVDEAVVGAQAGGYNLHSTGVAMIGSFNRGPLPVVAARALTDLLAWKLSLHGVPTSGRVVVRVTPGGAGYTRFRPNTPVSLNRIAGHRDGDATDCPGNALERQLPALRRRASARAGRAAALTIASSAPQVVYPGPVMLAGRLAYLDGTPIAGAPIELQTPPAGVEQTITTVITAADGTWDAALGLAQSMPLRALFRGDATHPASVSMRVQAAVAPAVTLQTAAAGTAPGQPLTLSGTIAPAKPQVTVVVLQRQPAGTLKPIQRVSVPVSNGQFSTAITFTSAGTYQLIAQVAADALNAAGASPPVTVTIS